MIIPGYRYIVIYKDMYTVYGGSVDFFYNLLGIFTFSNELDFEQYVGTSRAERTRTSEAAESSARRRFILSAIQRKLFYHQLALMGEQLVEWKPYKHPLYGDIEIGGAPKNGTPVPASFQLPGNLPSKCRLLALSC